MKIPGNTMRAIITTLFLILLSQNASATTIGELYKYCKPYADSGFNIPSNDIVETAEAFSCMFYFKGIVDVVRMGCDTDATDLSIFDVRIDADPINIDAYI